MTAKAPNDILKIPRDASPDEIAAAVKIRAAHLRDLSDASSQQALAEIYQAAAFLLWETKINAQARTAPGSITPISNAAPPVPSARTRKPRPKARKRRAAFAPLMIMVPTLAAVSLFLLYPENTMSAAWTLIDQFTDITTGFTEPTSETSQPALPTIPPIPTADKPLSSPASNAVIIATPPNTAPEASPTELPNPTKLRGCVTISSLNVRQGPDASYDKLSYLLEGECVTLVAQNIEGTWGLVETLPRSTVSSGWISLSYLNYTEPNKPLPIATTTNSSSMSEQE